SRPPPDENPNTAPAASALSIWARSFRGDQRSSSSRKLIHRPWAAATPALRATATPRAVSWRTTLTRGSSSSARRDDVSSCDPSSTTITSRSTSVCSRADGRAAVESRRQRLRVGMTTETSGPSGKGGLAGGEREVHREGGRAVAPIEAAKREPGSVHERVRGEERGPEDAAGGVRR